MMTKVYSIYDKKAMLYLHPILLDNDVFATRYFMKRMLNDEQMMIHCDDFRLDLIGEFNIETAEMKNMDAFVIVYEGRNAYLAVNKTIQERKEMDKSCEDH